MRSVNERANSAQKPFAGELNHHAGQLAGELNRHAGQLAGEFGRHVSRLAWRARPDHGLSDLLRLPFLAKHSLKARSEVNERANPAQKPLAGELNHHAGQLAGELNHHVGQLTGEINRRVVILACRAQPSRRSARRSAEPSCGCTRPASSTIAPVSSPAS
ncbi:hypothetical protein F2Q70_00031667 [Brassica cretica]|uniref:Uncharacterized protein n=1 Tax=Brassica cretica TaxID=69181 RepID=A0A8S9FIC7_BRACR|nr:hypothetical protein F2Q70_00031667 [Brassica cretica]